MITFVDGSDTEGIIVLDDGLILIDDGLGGGGIGGGGSPSIDCSSDRVAILTDYTIVDYVVAVNSAYVTLEPTVAQYLPGCPLQCMLDESSSGGIIQNNIFAIDSNTGRISIKTTSVSDIGDVPLRVTCESTLSTTQQRSDYDDFIVSLQEPSFDCRTDILDFMTPITQNIDYVV